MTDISILRDLMTQLKRWLPKAPEDPHACASGPSGPEPPEDPYSYVGAPKKPRLPHFSASASAPLE